MTETKWTPARNGTAIEPQADAHLIAAAPELYSELKYFHQWACGEFAMYRHSEHGERVEKLLAKARGEGGDHD